MAIEHYDAYGREPHEKRFRDYRTWYRRLWDAIIGSSIKRMERKSND
jgi:hypothetical protein